ncbi:MAG: pitrilysin family protein [Acidobacteriota bacterium]
MSELPPLHFPISRHRLGNGLQIVLQPDRSVPLVAVNLWYHVGSKNESPGKTGFAHLFEHLLFQGSANVGTNDHFRLVQKAGGVANGSTWYDRTNYFETLPSHQLELGLWLESDRMGYFLPAITSEKLENQRQVVMNERRQRVDNQPYGRAVESLYEALFPVDHPYRWPVIGYMEDIEAATLDMVEDFFATYYTPSNAVLTLAGDFDEDEALRLIGRYFAEIDAGGPIERPQIEAISLDGEQRRELTDHVKVPRIYSSYHAPRYGDDSWYAAQLLARVLSGGKSSVLYDDLVVNRRLAQDVGAYILPTECTATFSVVATAKPDADPAELDRALLDHLDRVAQESVPQDALDRARNGLVAAHYHELQGVAERADMISQFTTYFDAPEQAAGKIDRIQQLGRDDLQAFAQSYLANHQRAVVTVLPEKGTAA